VCVCVCVSECVCVHARAHVCMQGSHFDSFPCCPSGCGSNCLMKFGCLLSGPLIEQKGGMGLGALKEADVNA